MLKQKKKNKIAEVLEMGSRNLRNSIYPYQAHVISLSNMSLGFMSACVTSYFYLYLTEQLLY